MRNAAYITLALAILVWLLFVNDYRYGRFSPPLDPAALNDREITPNAPARRTPQYPAVLLFILDGATRDALYNPSLCPEITSRWLKFGLRYEDARAMPPSVSAPNYFSILSGAPPSVHGIVNNEVRSRRDLHAPTVFQSISDAGLDSRLVGFNWYKDLFGHLASYTPAECCEKDDPAEVAGAVSDMIRHADLPFFTVAHFLSPDNAAHATGSNKSERYLGSIKTIDSLLGGIFRLLDRVYPGALVIITSDHGMNVDGNHGGLDMNSIRVPLYLLSPSLPHAGVSRTVYHAAIAPTVAAAAGAALPVLSAVPPLAEALDARAKEYLRDSIRLRERMIAAFRFMYPIIPAPKFVAHEDDAQRDARLTAAIMERPARDKETLLLYQRLAFSLALLFLAAMAMRRMPAGTTTVLLVNGTVVAAAGVAMRVVFSAHAYAAAASIYTIVIVIITGLSIALLRRSPLYLQLRVPGSFIDLAALLLLETAIIGACFLPLYTFAPDENIFGVRFLALALWSPAIMMLLIKLIMAVESRVFLLAGATAGAPVGGDHHPA
ncbi:MAG TPA: alkaline phosphatase family protein [Spirochaetota bacterium]|nr:alkaline phosphatase family protein [Spirochaetota bacterium]